MDNRPSHPRMTLPGRPGRGGGRAARQPHRVPQAAADSSVLPASRLASTELQQEIAEQLLVLGAPLLVFLLRLTC